MKIHVEVYLAAKKLTLESKELFTASELRNKINLMFSDTRSGVSVYISSACCANAAKAHAVVYNYLTRTESGQYRLFKQGDPIDSSREGSALRPNIEDVDEDFHSLWEVDLDVRSNFMGFTDKNFAIFDLENRTYRTGDPIGEEAKGRLAEWKQFANIVVSATSKPFNIFTTQWQNSGNLSPYHWSALRDKEYEPYSTCLSMMITSKKILVNLGYHDRLDRLGKALDNKRQYNSWIQHCTPESIPEEYWDKLAVWVPDEAPVPFSKFILDQETKDGLLKRIDENKDLYIDMGRVFSQEEAISLGPDIVKEVVETLNILDPIYRGILQRAQDIMVLIGSSAEFSDFLDRYQKAISSQGAVMYWWSYIIREEYQALLRRNSPVDLYIYGTDQSDKRAITHVMTVSDFITSTGNEGLLSP